MTTTTAATIAQALARAFDECDSEHVAELLEDIHEEINVEAGTYGNVGMMTRDDGLVLRFGDAEFQITIVKTR